MARCTGCNAILAFGGIRSRGRRFCSEGCRDRTQVAEVNEIAAEIPEDVVESMAWEKFEQPCPKCGGVGPVELHQTYTIWSAVYACWRKTHSDVCCRRCAVKIRMWRIMACSMFGWWDVPLGLCLTPLQIARNIRGLYVSDGIEPSRELREHLRQCLANDIHRHRIQNE